MHSWLSYSNQMIEDRYRLRRVLGEGSFGCVFAGEEFLLERPLRPVAVKLIRPHAHLSRDRQVDELVHAIRLEHPAIIRGYAAGLCMLAEEELLYLVMELAKGSLAVRLREGPLPVDELHALALAVAGALAYCHTPPYHLVHCDVKPANLLSVHGQWKLSDFGLARALGARAQIRGLALGTLTYAPPEALSGLIAPAWDVWSLGMLLLEAATGRHPLAGVADPAEVLRQPLVLPALPAPFDAICAGCLRLDQRERWTAHQVLAALDAVQAPASVVSLPSAPPALPPHHLPQSAARFIGRERELSELVHLLADHRLISLTGVGGSGKTRLSLEAARQMLPHYRDGAWFVDLAPISDPAQIPAAMLHALHVPPDPARPALEVLTEYLADKRLLLIPDNCEHLVEACAQVADTLLRACPGVTLLCTSREVLRVEGELSYRVPALALPPETARIGYTSESIAPTRRSPSSSTALWPPIPSYRSPRPSPARWWRSAGGWTASRWRWSWPPLACAP